MSDGGTGDAGAGDGGSLPMVSTHSETYATAGAPFEAIASSSGEVFVSVSGTSAVGVQVFEPSDGGLAAKCVNALPSPLVAEGADFANLSWFPNGTDLAGGIGAPGAIFFHASDLLGCHAAGYVVSQGPISADEGSLSVAVTPDGNHAFVSNEYGRAAGAQDEGNIGVVAIARDAGGDFSPGTTLLGQIGTGGNAIAGMTLSSDGTRLYVTTEVRDAATVASGEGNPLLSETDCVQQKGGAQTANGLLTVIDVAMAEATPGPAAILAVINAGCSPVRMAETSDGATLWVSVRGDDRVLAFSTSLLESDPDNALVGHAPSGGTAPVGMHLFHGDALLAVTNSNRFGTGVANGAILYAVSVASASVLATFQTGLFPREVTVGTDDATLYVPNFDSDTFQVVTTTVQQ
jgi:DNA-binding beta-propeller fold protein YncE